MVLSISVSTASLLDRHNHINLLGIDLVTVGTTLLPIESHAGGPRLSSAFMVGSSLFIASVVVTGDSSATAAAALRREHHRVVMLLDEGRTVSCRQQAALTRLFFLSRLRFFSLADYVPLAEQLLVDLLDLLVEVGRARVEHLIAPIISLMLVITFPYLFVMMVSLFRMGTDLPVILRLRVLLLIELV